MSRLIVAAIAVVGTPLAAQPASGPPVRYELSFANAVHHEARIGVTYRDIGSAPLVLRMARSSPGRYAIHEFAKNVYDVSATDEAGRALTIRRTDPYSWTVLGHGGTVTVAYTLFADRGDGTYSQIDTTHAHLNSPATYLWAEGFEERPIELHFTPYEPDWRVATQLEPTDDAFTFRASDLAYLMDSPVEVSDHTLREWQVSEGGESYTIRLALHHRGSDADADRFAAMVRDVVDAQIALFGDIPDFDYGSYTFLADYLPHVDGDGMEHRNSTVMTRPQSLEEGEFAHIGTASHEFIHGWNVERLRPAELEPFDFTRADPTPSLWFAEGFTSYYGPLTIRRAGRSSIDAYLGELAGMLGHVLHGPGRNYGSPQEMSLRAPFTDAATAIDPTNHANIFTSYYPYGAIVALALDLTLRRDFPGVSLDDYMRHMWRTHGVAETPYRPEDLEQGLAEVTGDAGFARDFFATTVHGSHLPDFAPLLEQAGLLLRQRDPTKPWAGPVEFDENDSEDRVTLAINSVVGTPIYEAGIDRGDRILQLAGEPIDDAEDWEDTIEDLAPGEAVAIRFVRRGEELVARLTIASDPALEIVRIEAAGQTPSEAQLAFRGAWLGPPGAEQ